MTTPASRVVRNLLFIDSETTGLDAQHHEMIEVGAILTTPDASKVLDSFEAKLKPQYIERAHPKALEVNGYNETEWSAEKCGDPMQVGDRLVKMAKDVILVGQNVSFDEGFVTAFLKKVGLKPSWHYHKVDTMGLAWPFYATQKLDGLSLHNICAFLGLPPEPKLHRAMYGAQKARDVYLALMARYEPVLVQVLH